MSESNQLQGCAITGIGSYVPERVLTNADLAEMVDTNDEWITTRTGIKQRRMAAEGEFTSTMAVAAARKALAQAELNRPISISLSWPPSRPTCPSPPPPVWCSRNSARQGRRV